MNCEDTTDLLSDRLNGQLSNDDKRRLERHLAGCAACRAEAEAVTEMWNDMDSEEIPVPHERMRARFHAALAAYDERTRATSFDRVMRYLWPQRPAVQLGTALALLLVGIIAGRSVPGPVDDEIAGLRQDMRLVSIALLRHQSATERLRGVESLQRVPTSADVTDALLEVVRNDRNVNVRLAAVEALGTQLRNPNVGAALTDAFNREQAPLMQVTLAVLLLRHDVDGSLGTVQQFIERDEVDASVRDYLRAVMDSNAPSDQLL
ncbi:MAG TPA: zf-HC2 domain-containing protein [Gammaproteobacteria bacterium]|nr:zf-HC2 domain-containing protein [Gammaproteobacteria bacterium]